MRTRSIAALLAFAVLIAASPFASAERLMRPVSINEARSSALYAFRDKGVNPWRSENHATQLGITHDGRTIVMVKSPQLKTPGIVAVKRSADGWGCEATILKGKALTKLSIVTPSAALRTAMKSGGYFGKVKGDVQLAGAANKGQAYKFVITPKTPVDVKVPYGTYTVAELTRWVNVLGRGESAAPTGASKFNYKYASTATKPAP
jgi:hypothetical protein